MRRIAIVVEFRWFFVGAAIRAHSIFLHKCWANKITYRLQRFVTVRWLGWQPTRNVSTKHLFCSSFLVCQPRHKVMSRGMPRDKKKSAKSFQRVSVARSWLEGVAVFAQFKDKSHKCIGWQRSLERFNITKAIYQPKGRPSSLISFQRRLSATNKPEPRNLFTFFVDSSSSDFPSLSWQGGMFA